MMYGKIFAAAFALGVGILPGGLWADSLGDDGPAQASLTQQQILTSGADAVPTTQPAILKPDTLDKAEAKQRGISVDQVVIERAAATIAAMRARIVKLESENAALKADILKRRASPQAGSSPPTTQSATPKRVAVKTATHIPTVTMRYILDHSRQYIGKTVKVRIFFAGMDRLAAPRVLDPYFGFDAGSVKVALADREKYSKYISFNGSEHLYRGAPMDEGWAFVADKAQYGDLVERLQNDDVLLITGVVSPAGKGQGIVCTSIEKVSR